MGARAALALVAAFAALTAGIGAAEIEVFVSPSGSDISGNGTLVAPFLTLQKAQSALQAARNGGAQPARVWLRGGRYPQARLAPLVLSGVADSNVTWQAYPADAAQGLLPVVTGAELLSEATWTAVDSDALGIAPPTTAAGKVYRTPLAAANISASGLGDPGSDGGMHAAVVVDGRATHLARWPDADAAGRGNWTWVVGAPSGGHGDTIGFNTSRPLRWVNASAPMLHGYFFYWWRDHRCTVTRVDPVAKTITASSPIGAAEGVQNNTAYYAYNLLEELDAAGEVYIDRASAELWLYVFRADGTAPSPQEVEVSLATQPLLSVEGASDVAFVGINFTASQATGVEVVGGYNVSFTACNVLHMGSSGIYINNGTAHKVSSCNVQFTGHSGVGVSGGNRYTLVSSQHVVENSTIGNFGRWIYTYNPAVAMSGVGVVARHNYIHDGAHTALLVGGNNHQIASNVFHNVVMQGYDSGAIYSDRDWTYRGNEIVGNLFLDIGSVATPCNSHTACIRMGVYVDDHASGFLVHNNVFVNMQTGMFSHNGRDHTINNNLFIDVGLPVRLSGALHMGTDNATLYQRLFAMPYQNPPWSTEYPRLANLLDDHPAWPLGNNMTANVAVNTTGPSAWQQKAGWKINTQGWISLDPQFGAGNWTVGKNLVSSHPGFASADPIGTHNFTLLEGSPAFAMGWQQLPTDFGPTGWH